MCDSHGKILKVVVGVTAGQSAGLADYIVWKTSQAVLTGQALTYNAHISRNYVIDFLMEPIFWFVNNFAHCLGKIFVIAVIILTTALVAVAYWIGLPYWWQRCPFTTTFLVIFGHWLLGNVIFHYYMGVKTPPGYPPHGAAIIDAVSICKKCIAPKPPRTHHCSVCDRCVLAMDHHCPWLNNCVGYYNARHFFLYMVYMVAGVTFVMLAGIDIGYHVIWLKETVEETPNNDPDLIGHPVHINQTGALIPVKHIAEYDSVNFPREHDLPIPTISEVQRIVANPYKRLGVNFAAAICVSVFVSLGLLSIRHAKNINRGETSIEYYINTMLRKNNPGTFRNPYDFGVAKNWKLFLGLTQGRTFVRHTLFPSTHKPAGNGLTFHTVHDGYEDWP